MFNTLPPFELVTLAGCLGYFVYAGYSYWRPRYLRRKWRDSHDLHCRNTRTGEVVILPAHYTSEGVTLLCDMLDRWGAEGVPESEREYYYENEPDFFK
jgi:hypothetical protein